MKVFSETGMFTLYETDVFEISPKIVLDKVCKHLGYTPTCYVLKDAQGEFLVDECEPIMHLHCLKGTERITYKKHVKKKKTWMEYLIMQLLLLCLTGIVIKFFVNF